jgi:tetratricopeptide (TPR) repeat protein
VEQGEPDRAIRILSDYLRTHPHHTSVRVALGQAYVIAGQNSEAQAEYQKVLEDAPGNVTAVASLGDIYFAQGELDKAEAMLGRATKLEGTNPQLRIEWALVLARLHKYRAAESALSHVTPPTAPQQRVGFYRLEASVASGLGHNLTAASEMEKALALEPQDAGLIMATAAAELQSGKWDRAAGLAEPLYSRTRDPQAGALLLEAQLGMHEDFHKTFDSLHAVELQPAEELALRQRLAEILITHGEYSSSIEELVRAVELDPNRGDLTFNLALAEFKAGRLDDALDSAEGSRALHDTADLEDLLGDIQEARGDNLAAVRSYQAAVALAPNDENYRLSLAVEFIRHNNFDAARVVLKQAEELWPNSWRVQLAQGMVEYFAGSYQEASRILIRAADLAREPEAALGYLGEIQMDQASAPTPAVIRQLCGYADQHSKDGKFEYYCGGLQFRRDYGTGDKTHANEIVRRLRLAANRESNDPAPHCQLGKVYRWLEQWPEARAESESCVRMDPGSADGHYRMAQIYQHLGESERSRQEMALYKAASQRMAEENLRRDQTMKTFLYTIQKETPSYK